MSKDIKSKNEFGGQSSNTVELAIEMIKMRRSVLGNSKELAESSLSASELKREKIKVLEEEINILESDNNQYPQYDQEHELSLDSQHVCKKLNIL